MITRQSKGAPLNYSEMDQNLIEAAASGGSKFAQDLGATTNSNYYDNEYELFTFNYDGETTIKYTITALMYVYGGTTKITFNGQITLPANIMSLSNDTYAVALSDKFYRGYDHLENGVGVDQNKVSPYSDEAVMIRLKKSDDGTCKLFLHVKDDNDESQFFATYEVLNTSFGLEAMFDYPRGGQ